MQGKWEVYKDGHLADTGCGLSEGGRVKKGGLLVIGQEQDEPGGRFSAAESFHGRITRLDIWSRALEQQQLLELKSQCDYYFGDLLGWPDVYTGLRGEIKVGPGSNKTIEKVIHDKVDVKRVVSFHIVSLSYYAIDML